MNDPIRLVIVDDHLLFAQAVRSRLEAEGMSVQGVARNSEEAEALIEATDPHLVLMDLGLPGKGGAELGAELIREFPELRVVAVTGMNSGETARQVMEAGFHGYLIKDTPFDEFVSSLRAVLGGQVVISQRIARQATGARTSAEREVSLMADQLTTREMEVLTLITEGASGETIAKHLFISPNTVRTHIQSILTKLQVHSRLEAAAFAVRHGLVKPYQGQLQD
jgi:DNA-binding NarL/FixJ family response regulator